MDHVRPLYGPAPGQREADRRQPSKKSRPAPSHTRSRHVQFAGAAPVSSRARALGRCFRSLAQSAGVLQAQNFSNLPHRQSLGGHQTSLANRNRRTVPGSDCRQRSPNHPINRVAAYVRRRGPLSVGIGGRFASDSATRCIVRLSGWCRGGALVTKLTACSKRSHASGSNAGSSAGSLPVAFVFFIAHLSLRLEYEVPQNATLSVARDGSRTLERNGIKSKKTLQLFGIML
jgi:hypothetical protein